MVISSGAIAMNRVTDCEKIIKTVRKEPIVVLIKKTGYLEFVDVRDFQGIQRRKDWAAPGVTVCMSNKTNGSLLKGHEVLETG